MEFCPGNWYTNGHHHRCVKAKGHDGACWCCEVNPDRGDDDNYPGGDLSLLMTPEDRAVLEAAERWYSTTSYISTAELAEAVKARREAQR